MHDTVQKIYGSRLDAVKSRNAAMYTMTSAVK